MQHRNHLETSAEENGVIALSDVMSKGTVTVVRLAGGTQFRSKIASLGMLPGMPINLLQHNRRGPVLISVFGETLMLGEGMAEKILVKKDT